MVHQAPHTIDVAAPCLRYAHARAVSRNIKAHLFQQNAERLSFEDNLVLRTFVLSPRSASSATRALKSAVNRRRVTIVVLLHYLAEYTLATCPIFQDQLSNPGKGGVADSIGHYLKLKYPDFNPKRILDLGCTIGSNLFPYHDVYPDAELYGVDVAAPCLRYAHARAVSRNIKAHLFQQNAERLSFEDNTFDLVVSSFFFHELSVVATQRVLAECHRILKPGGMMVQMELPATSQVDAFYNFVLDWDNEHNNEPDYRDFRSQNFYALMTGAGFAHGDCFTVSIPDASEEHFRQVALGEAPPPKHGNYTSWRLFGATKTG